MMEYITATMERASWYTVLQLQINPIIPASRFGHCVRGGALEVQGIFANTLLAILPPQLMLVELGSAHVTLMSSTVPRGTCSAHFSYHFRWADRPFWGDGLRKT